ncbi:MAG: sulfite exporter TauE/SafE family protein [Patescibacteria group bacterium]
MKKYTLHVSGTHCASCKILVEDVLGEQDFLKNIRVDLKKEIIEFETENQKSESEILNIFNSKLNGNGYVFSLEKKIQNTNGDTVIWTALPLGIFVLVMFFILQKSGVLNFGIGGNVTPLTSFIIGLVASVSSCLVIVGGLVLSLSVKVSEDKISDTKNFIFFHASRLLSFALLGGVLGILGSALGVNFTFTNILGIIASIVMIGLGLHLTGIFKRNRITLPVSLFNFFRKVEHKTFTPIILGFSTFFLPCGFTQSMQVVALGSGSFISGALIMFAFSLGTMPVLAFLSFGSASFAHSKHAPLFFKTAGIVVIGFGLFAFLSGLASLGVINPLFNI